MFDLSAIQAAVSGAELDGWLLCDFRGNNPLARRVVGIPDDAHATRRWFYYVPASGVPRKLAHAIEPGRLDHLPGDTTLYRRWQELEAGVGKLLDGATRVAMEYSPRNANPYVSRVDAGGVELVRSFGAEVVSSGDIIQEFEATWTDEQWALHREAERHTTAAYDVAWKFIADEIRAKGRTSEVAVQDRIMAHFAANGLVTDHPPIVGANAHSADPHFAPSRATDTPIKPGDFVLIDLWAKMDRPGGVYSDLTRVGYVGDAVPEKYVQVFNVVAAARDAAIGRVKAAFAANEPLMGWQVDEACREVIEKAGYGDAFVHRTGHNIGTETHGNGAHMDGFETRDDRRVIRRTCFSVEPGIYLPGEFGARSEVNVFVDVDGHVHVTGGPVQAEIVRVV